MKAYYIYTYIRNKIDLKYVGGSGGGWNMNCGESFMRQKLLKIAVLTHYFSKRLQFHINYFLNIFRFGNFLDVANYDSQWFSSIQLMEHSSKFHNNIFVMKKKNKESSMWKSRMNCDDHKGRSIPLMLEDLLNK